MEHFSDMVDWNQCQSLSSHKLRSFERSSSRSRSGIHT